MFSVVSSESVNRSMFLDSFSSFLFDEVKSCLFLNHKLENYNVDVSRGVFITQTIYRLRTKRE